MELTTLVLDPDLDALLDTIPCTARHPRTVEDLPGGLTNRNLKVTNADGTCVVRIPAAGTSLLGIDRDAEHANSVAAAEAGVGAPVLHYRPGEGSPSASCPAGRSATPTCTGPTSCTASPPPAGSCTPGRGS